MRLHVLKQFLVAAVSLSLFFGGFLPGSPGVVPVAFAQDDFGFDLTASYTYSPEFWLNLTAGLDIDLMMADNFAFKAWIPLNAGVSFGDIIFIFFEYDLPVNENAWDIISLGANFIIR